MTFKTALTGLAVLIAAGPAMAHHSFAMFDATKSMTLQGTVKELELINPHAWLYVVAKDEKGAQIEWALEMGGAGALGRAGWKPDTVKPGDKIEVQIHPLKDGTHGGQFLTAKLVDGTKMEGGDIGLPPALR